MSDWLDRHTRAAPVVLRDCVRQHVKAVSPDGSDADVLARAARHALARVTTAPEGGRAIALDLLAADALITLALLAQSQVAPDRLEDFAAWLLEEPILAG